MKTQLKLISFAILITAFVFAGCGDSSGTSGADPDVDVAFISAIQTGGSSGTADSTALELTFDGDPTSLTVDNITVTGATKGALTGTGNKRTLVIADITVANQATVSVTITNPAGYAITGSPQTAMVYTECAKHCPGCCDGSNNCLTGDRDDACGSNGSTCSNCSAAGRTCNNGLCK